MNSGELVHNSTMIEETYVLVRNTVDFIGNIKTVCVACSLKNWYNQYSFKGGLADECYTYEIRGGGSQGRLYQ